MARAWQQGSRNGPRGCLCHKTPAGENWHSSCVSPEFFRRIHALGDARDLHYTLRILFCNYEYPPLGGGGGVVMAAMARSLAERHDVTVLTSQAVDLPLAGMDANVKVVRVPVFFRKTLATANFPSMAAYLPMGLWRGLQLGRKQRFDIINTHFAVPSGPLGDWLSKRLA